MGRLARVSCGVSALAVLAVLVAPAAAGPPRDVSPAARVVTRAIVHGKAVDGSQRRPTSLGPLAVRVRRASGVGVDAAAPIPSAPQPVFGFEALTDPVSVPSDTTGALGDGFFVTAVNTKMAVYDLTGVAVVPETPLEELHPDSVGEFVFDPKVVYDQFRDTFVLTYLVQTDSPRVSRIFTVTIPNATATDTNTWCSTKFPGDLMPGGPRLWADFPGLGYDESRVTITTNQFTFPSSRGRFRYAQILSMPKDALYDCTADAPAPDVFGGTSTLDPNRRPSFTLQPAQTVDSPARSQMLLSVEILGRDSYLVLWRIRASVAGLALKKAIVPIGRAMYPLPGTQGGGGLRNRDTLWDAGDGRLINAFYDADANELYAAHSVFRDLRPDTVTGDYPETVVRWYEVRPAARLRGSRLARKGTIGAPEVDAGWPSVATDASGNLFVAYSRAGAPAGEFLSAWIAEIAPGSSAATQLVLAPGVSTYNAVNGPERWGDYTAINRDPQSPARVATFNQYAADRETWQQVVHVVQHV